jgi:hypothetical protein
VEEAWKDWLAQPLNRNIKALPLILNWGFGLARNAMIFQDKSSLPELLVSQGLSILEHFPQEKGVRRGRVLQEVSVDSNRPWAFFDGASQENNTCCGGGAVLFLSNTHLFRLKMGLGPGTNNFAELMSLKLLLLFALEKNVPFYSVIW